ncbi:MAG: TlpA disulfide reductase family protein, partial [Gemmatimonadota bacterium]
AAPLTGRSLAVVLVAAFLGIATWGVVHYVPGKEIPQVSHRAPDYRVARIPSGDSIGIRSANAGHVTLINVWATWCGPCVKEMPSMERLYQAYRDRGFRVAAVSIDSDLPAPVLAFAKQLGLSFDILHDRIGEIQTYYMTVGVPESFLIDKRGIITYIALGAEEWDSPENRQRIERLLAAGD